MTSRLRQIFASTEPTTVEATQRRQQLAQAMQVRALQGTKVAAENYTPGLALTDLATALLSKHNMNKANAAYDRAKDAKSKQTSEALKRYSQSVPDEQVGAVARDRIMDPNLPANELPEPVEPRSAAYGGLVDTLDEDSKAQITKALIAQQMAPKERGPIKLGAGESLIDPESFKPVYAQPAAPSKPLDPLGQLEADRRAGLIDDEGFNARRELLTTRAPPATLQVQMVPMSPQEIAAAGLPSGTAAQRNVQTGQIDVLSKRDNTGVLNQKDATTAKMKLNTVSLARQQLNAIKESFEAGRSGGLNAFGPGQGMLPTQQGKQFDARVDQMRSTLTALTRVPGVGAMSDYETKLDQSKFPARGDYETVTADKLAQLEDMLALIETGYTDLLGNGAGTGPQGQQPGIQAPPGAQAPPQVAPPTPAAGQAPPEAIAFLKAHPEVAEQFKAKYGYLP
jgi:hypothetical protein